MLKQNLNRTSHFTHPTSNKGITLIVLIITIIVMLILVAVTISMAINGGLFEKAGQAVGEMKNAINYEQQLADGKIKIGDKWYASIDDYLNNNPITTGITVDKEALTLKKKETAEVEGEEILTGTITASTFGMETEPEITWEVSPADQTAVTLSGTTGKTITVTAVGTKTATATVTAKCTYEGTEYSAPCEVKLKIMPIAILKVGDYVNYTPDTGTYKVADGANGSGIDTTETGYQEFTTGSNLLWRVWSINEETGEVEIILSTVGPKVTLNGADGYNHAVDILNDLCETLYSKTVNESKVATGRSINVEDINAKTTYSPIGETDTNTGLTYKDTIRLSDYYSKSKMKYPNLYSQEIGYGTAGIFNTTGLNGETGLKDGVTDEVTGVTTYSTVTGYTDGYTAGTDPYITHTYYGYNGSSSTYYPEQCLDTSLGINTAPAGLIKLSSNYWLASRCVRVYWSVYSRYTGFELYLMGPYGEVEAWYLFTNGGTSSSSSLAVRPVVSLGSNVSLEYDFANSTSSTTYWNLEF